MEQKNDRNVFIYHPDPIATGAFQTGDAVCDCCKSPTSIFYTGPFYAKDSDLLFCPDCIQSGAAAKKFQGCFTAPDHCDNIGNPEKLEEICYRTPGYYGIQQEQWIAHCGDYCAYRGEISYHDLTPELLADFKATWNDRPHQIWNLEYVCGSLGLAYEGYLFQCLHCGKYLLYAQRD